MCEFNHATDPDCPIFRLKHIVSGAGEEFQDIAVKVRPEFNMIILYICIIYSSTSACLSFPLTFSCQLFLK